MAEQVFRPQSQPAMEEQVWKHKTLWAICREKNGAILPAHFLLILGFSGYEHSLI